MVRTKSEVLVDRRAHKKKHVPVPLQRLLGATNPLLALHTPALKPIEICSTTQEVLKTTDIRKYLPVFNLHAYPFIPYIDRSIERSMPVCTF